MKLEIRKLVLAAMFTAAMCIGSWVKIPFLFVPMTLQVFFVNTAILTQETKYAVLSVAAYIFLGLAGVPVFSGGGGLAYLLSPTFGYIIGFLMAAISSGFIRRKSIYLQSAVNELLLYICGLTYFYLISNIYLNSNISLFKIFVWCFLVFIPGDLLSVSLSCTLTKSLHKRRILAESSWQRR